MTGTLHLFTPTYRPAGGVVKVMDYAQHARSFGYRVSVWSREPVDREGPLFRIDRFADLAGAADVEFHSRNRLDLGDEDLIFMTLPIHYRKARRALGERSPERVVHIIQNVRHVNPEWDHGYAARLLTRPLARISINRIVGDVIAPWLDPRALHRVVNLGHDVGYFHHERSGPLGRPVRVAYTTWKSDIGDHVARSLPDDGFEFRAIRETATWSELRELYAWSDVFLASPGPEEGLYLPGLEAMAAGSVVVTPDVGGNLAYCRPGANCLLVGYEQVVDYRAALLVLRDAPAARIEELRSGGYAVTADFDLDAERRGFGDFLDELWPRVRAHEDRRR